MQADIKTAVPVLTPVAFTDEDLLTISNGLILELKRTANTGQVASLEHALRLYRRLETVVAASIERLKSQEPQAPESPNDE